MQTTTANEGTDQEAVGPLDTMPSLDPAPATPDRSPTGRVLTETSLVARAQDGDADAFEELVRRYEAALFRLGYRMLSDRGDAQDAVQDTFVLAWRSLPSLSDPEAFRAWVYQLMTRRCLNVIRVRDRRRTGVAYGTDFEAETAGSRPVAVGGRETPAAEVETAALQHSLNAALAELPADQRACWVLHEMHDLSYPAIAYAIGVPVSTVRGRIARARLQLAKGLSAWR